MFGETVSEERSLVGLWLNNQAGLAGQWAPVIPLPPQCLWWSPGLCAWRFYLCSRDSLQILVLVKRMLANWATSPAWTWHLETFPYHVLWTSQGSSWPFSLFVCERRDELAPCGLQNCGEDVPGNHEIAFYFLLLPRGLLGEGFWISGSRSCPGRDLVR